MNGNNNIPNWAHDRLIHGYWVIPDRLLATEYPGAKTREKAAEKLATLLDAGVSSFVDLTEAGEKTWGGNRMKPYDALLRDVAAQRGLAVDYRRHPIRDCSITTDVHYDEILEHIRAELAGGRVVVVHCWGGKGRTGTVVGSWLIDEQGLGYPEVIDRMQELRRGSKKDDQPVPETQEQHDVLRRRAQRKGA
ncbi:MAG: tyrosine-protein phosphatase [Mycobacterium sp.]|nr:tyrosine-protein phosphatase [Mycobacterium sp.]